MEIIIITMPITTGIIIMETLIIITTGTIMETMGIIGIIGITIITTEIGTIIKIVTGTIMETVMGIIGITTGITTGIIIGKTEITGRITVLVRGRMETGIMVQTTQAGMDLPLTGLRDPGTMGEEADPGVGLITNGITGADQETGTWLFPAEIHGRAMGEVKGVRRRIKRIKKIKLKGEKGEMQNFYNDCLERFLWLFITEVLAQEGERGIMQ